MIWANDNKQRLEVTDGKGNVVAWLDYEAMDGPDGPRNVADFFRNVLLPHREPVAGLKP